MSQYSEAETLKCIIEYRLTLEYALIIKSWCSASQFYEVTLDFEDRYCCFPPGQKYWKSRLGTRGISLLVSMTGRFTLSIAIMIVAMVKLMFKRTIIKAIDMYKSGLLPKESRGAMNELGSKAKCAFLSATSKKLTNDKMPFSDVSGCPLAALLK